MDLLKKKFSVTIPGIFPGAGKTTLLNHVLNNCEGLKKGVTVDDINGRYERA